MAVDRMLISPAVRDKLGDRGVTEVGSWLWAVDCQTCGRPLGSRPPALCVDDMIAFAAASLHHEECRAPQWGQGPFTGLGGSDRVTHRSRLIMLPTGGEGSSRAIPVMVVNPTMELVMLGQADGRWRPQYHATFTAAAMVPPGPQLHIYRPLPGTSARLTRTAVTVTMPPPAATDHYECGLGQGDEPIHRAIAGEGGVLLAVTHAVDPHAGDFARQFAAALRGGRMLCGWIPLPGK